jgi:hypothetical protein
MRKALLAAAALLIVAGSMPDNAFAQRGGRGFAGGGFRGGGFGGYGGGLYRGGIGYRGGAIGYRGGAIGYRGGAIGYRGAAIGYRGGVYRSVGWRPGWGWGAPIAAGIALGAIGYGYGGYGYGYDPYYYGGYSTTSCLAWDGYQWVNICY